ncbi:MAG: DUF6048 family protein [Ekhidna sp.]|nr:DUF6048 family protein [Ekhidna sp.]
MAGVSCFGQVGDSLSIRQDSILPVVLNQADSATTEDPEIQDAPEVKEPKRFFTPSIYLDYGKLLTIPFDFEAKYEGGLTFLFMERIPLIIEAGSAALSPKGAYANGNYEISGVYYRFGIGYVGSKDSEHNAGISVRYGMSSFDESGQILVESTSEIQRDLVKVTDRKGLTADWWELVVYTDQRLFKDSEMFWIGLNLRMRILQSYDAQEEIDVYAIPGYGRAFDKTIPAANLFLKIKF